MPSSFIFQVTGTLWINHLPLPPYIPPSLSLSLPPYIHPSLLSLPPFIYPSPPLSLLPCMQVCLCKQFSGGPHQRHVLSTHGHPISHSQNIFYWTDTQIPQWECKIILSPSDIKACLYIQRILASNTNLTATRKRWACASELHKYVWYVYTLFAETHTYGGSKRRRKV